MTVVGLSDADILDFVVAWHVNRGAVAPVAYPQGAALGCGLITNGLLGGGSESGGQDDPD